MRDEEGEEGYEMDERDRKRFFFLPGEIFMNSCIVEIRRLFPGKIDHLASTHKGTLRSHTENLLRISFEDLDYEVC